VANGQRRRPAIWLLLAFLVLGIVGQAVPLYTDWLWFHEVGYAQVFTTVLTLRGWLVLGLGLAVWIFLFANLWIAARTAPPDVLWELEDQLGLPGRASIEPLVRRFLVPVTAVIAFISGARASAAWDTLIEYLNATSFGRVDPIFGRDLGFYFFELPFWRLLYGWGITLAAGTLVLTAAVYVLQRSLVLTARGPRLAAAARTHLLALGALLLVLRGVGFWLDRFDLLYSSRGAVFGASYADVNAALPVYNVLTALALLCAAACLVQMSRPGWLFPVAGLVVLVVVWVGGLGLYPAALQRLRVKPNEIVFERPYIQHNIRMTRHAFGLDRVQEKDFPVEENLNAAALDRNVLTIKNIRLWDHRPLLTTYGQLQEIRTYYKFLDVDNDRYTLNGEYRQVMLSPRELSYRHLPGQQQNWINEHLTYTHGYGLVVGPVNRISPEGLPEFFVKDIPPGATGFPKITQPEMYYGESGNDYVFVRTQSPELDYPSGDQNVYSKYAGRGGVPVDSLMRKLAFAARFGEFKILLSNDLTAESRIMIYRSIRDRVRQAAPFVRFDRDPYLVVTDDGRLIWMVDGYTASDRYPYAQPVRGIGNYIRNSVKVTVDAFHGTVTYYIADPDDPIVQTYSKAFPGLMRPLVEMPKDLQSHIRYPEDLFTLQMQMYATYHMEDPQVFYNKEDLWTIPRRPQDGRTAAATEMEPYYTVMRLPGEPREEFALLGAFNPSRRDNMIAIMVGRADAPNYGNILVYVFPKQKLVYGPRQIDARIDQDPVISQQLALWNQQGSRVLRGSLLAIPIEGSLIYVQPLYLSATEQGALPELRRVIVAYGNQIAMEPTLEQALTRVFGARVRGDESPRAAVAPGAAPRPTPDASSRALIQRAWEAWQKGQEAVRRGDWATYGVEQKRLEEVLRQLSEGR
jgi:uncharacterized membrane protein (UPF0182 family)